MLSTTIHVGTAAINLTGNELDQTIIGNDGANILNGGGGADVLDRARRQRHLYRRRRRRLGRSRLRAAATTSSMPASSYTLGAGSQVEIAVDRSTMPAPPRSTSPATSFARRSIGNAGANILNGGGGADVLVGLGGNDTYYVDVAPATGRSRQRGGGNDAVYSVGELHAGRGPGDRVPVDRQLLAATHAINLTGNELANTIFGNDGANILDGKGGNDSLVGLGGADTFAFTTALGAGNVDLVFGFEPAPTRSRSTTRSSPRIGGLGALNANAFVAGAAAHDADDRIIYNSATGQLFYDADGNGAGAAVQFATLSPGLALTASDFQVI